MARVAIIGAGVTGLWHAMLLAKAGHETALFEKSASPFEAAASRIAGAMLAPYCEAEATEPIIVELGLRGLELWRRHYPGTISNGALVIAPPRDQAELRRFSRMTQGHETLSRDAIAALEPDLAPLYASALFYAGEGHIEPLPAMRFLLNQAIESGCAFTQSASGDAANAPADADWTIDCRGLAASADLPELRGVRGEMLVVQTHDIAFARPIRLLHPRVPLYVVPWGEGRFMLGATIVESGEGGAVSVRSALDLLGAAYTLHPAFGEARIISMAAGVRPAFPDNLPKLIVKGRTIYANGLYRHGFLLSPVLAEMTLGVIGGAPAEPRVVFSA